MKWNEKTFAKFTYLQDVAISNDGSMVAYVLRKANLKENKYENKIVIEGIEDIDVNIFILLAGIYQHIIVHQQR